MVKTSCESQEWVIPVWFGGVGVQWYDQTPPMWIELVEDTIKMMQSSNPQENPMKIRVETIA